MLIKIEELIIKYEIKTKLTNKIHFLALTPHRRKILTKKPYHQHMHITHNMKTSLKNTFWNVIVGLTKNVVCKEKKPVLGLATLCTLNRN